VNRFAAASVCALFAIACAACSGNATSPTPLSAATITFSNITVSRAPVGVYAEAGFFVSPGRGDWITWTDYGNPRPFIEFFSASGDVSVFAAQHAAFRFRSVDLYSSVTPIPYTLTGYRDDAVAFSVTDRLPNTFGAFRTVSNPRADVAIDTLVISLANNAAIQNPMGIDNIALTP